MLIFKLSCFNAICLIHHLYFTSSLNIWWSKWYNAISFLGTSCLRQLGPRTNLCLVTSAELSKHHLKPCLFKMLCWPIGQLAIPELLHQKYCPHPEIPFTTKVSECPYYNKIIIGFMKHSNNEWIRISDSRSDEIIMPNITFVL